MLLPRLVTVGAVCLLLLGPLAPIAARTKQEINAEKVIIQNQLKAAEAELAKQKTIEANATSEFAKLESQLAQVEAELQVSALRNSELERSRESSKVEIEEYEKLQDLQVNSAYLGWKTGGFKDVIFGGGDPLKRQLYHELAYTDRYGGILGIASELAQIEKDYADSYDTAKQLQGKLEELSKQKQELQAKLATYRSNTAKSTTTVKQLKSQISFLSKEDQDILKKEQDIVDQTGHPPSTGGGGGPAPTPTPVPGQPTPAPGTRLYFEGRGSDFVTGHGIGLSQNGALGAAMNLGWDFKQIVEFYFPGAKVQTLGNLPSTITVTGPTAVLPVEDYVAGLGEVPSVACEDLGVAFNANNYWGCWPKAAILAQVVVARTYAARRAGGICRTDACQVYNGGQAKRWAADATAGQVVVWGGGLADVYYSSDNNQGNGTADKETVWGGSRVPYLTNANDSSFAFKAYYSACKMWCGNWTWRTNSYSPAELRAFVDWATSNGYTTLAPLKNAGTIQNVSLGKDSSQRANSVTFTGTGGAHSVPAWRFRPAWNAWVGATKPSGQRDLMYSFTFSVGRV